MRRIIIITLIALALALGVGIANYALVHSDMRAAINGDARNAGLVVYGYHEKFVVPATIVIDLRDVSGTNSPADVLRLLLQFAEKQKTKNYGQVILSFRGEPRFMLKGDYFKTLGEEYGTQNPVYTMRTMPENLFGPDGERAFGTWTGGVLGVLGKQMEDFNEFHKRWYINELAKSGG